MLPGKSSNLLFIITAILYVAAIPLKPYLFDPLLKIIPLFVLLTAAYGQLSGRIRLLGLLAIVLCALGDVLLTQTFPNSFIYGLGSFLVGHIIYLIAFLQFANRQFFTTKAVMSVAVIATALTLALTILPATNELLIPVAAYICIITCMVIVAFFAWNKSMLHIVGALMFMVSDATLAWNMFLEPLPFAAFIVMITYYIAQFFMVAGLIKLFTDRQIHSSL